MYFVALATDYDGTLAQDGRVDETTLKALENLRASGRKIILVTGRELQGLAEAFPHLETFDLVVCENGALLYDPASKRETLLCEPPPLAFAERLRERGVTPLSVGRAVIATRVPNEKHVLDAIRELGLAQHIIFNKGAVMALPSGVNKASGLTAALKILGLSAHNVVAVGDAENDLPFLQLCGCAVAVANALPSVRDKCDHVVADHGAGVAELIEALRRDDLASSATGRRAKD